MTPRRPLDRERVLRGALELVDAEGLQRLTMRRLASDLGVTAMALYNHVSGREELLEGVADLVAREMAPVDPGGDWRDRVSAWARGIRAAYLAHPNAVAAVQGTAAITANLMAPMRAVVAALEDAGFPPADARAGWTAVVALVNGHVGYQLGGNMAARDATERIDFDAAFAFAVDALLAGLEALRRSRPGHGAG